MSDISTKLTYLATTKSKIKDVINMTGVGITNDTFRSYAQSLYDGYIATLQDKGTLLDNMNKGTSTGAISGSANLPVYEYKASKLSTQETTTGKNLANIYVIPNTSKITIANDTISITNNDNTAGYFNTYKKLSDLCPNLQVGDTVYLFFNSTSSSSGKNMIYITGYNNSWGITQAKVITQTMLDGYVILYGGYNETAVISNFMITKVNNNSYEPFTNGPSPNPSYPQEVNTVKGYRNLIETHLPDTTEVNGVTITQNTDGSFSLSGTATADARLNLTSTNDKLYFTLAELGLNIGDTAIFNGCVNGSSSTYYLWISSSPNYYCYSGDTTISVTSDNINRNLYMAIDVKSGTNVNGKIFKPMIIKGNISKPYVPYGNNYIYTTVCGKNIFNGKIELGSINPADGTTTNSTARTRSVNFIKVKPNTTYYYTRQSGGIRWIVGYKSDKTGITDGNFGGYASAIINYNYDNLGGTFTTTPTTEYIKWYDTNDTDVNEQVQIELGMQSTTYEAYKERIITIPLNNNEICGIGDYKDELVIDKYGHAKLTKKIGEITYNGTENWSMSDNKYLVSPAISDILTTLSNVYCNLATYIGFSELKVNTDNRIGLRSTTSQFWLRLSQFATKDDFKTWLTTHTMYVYYPLATPTEIDLGNIDMELYEGTNNITNNENMDMSIRFIKDTYE